jgi:GNAT superfamily N-acetyltransferase
MRNGGRNSFEDEGWILEPFVDFSLADDFDCGDADLNDFFRTDLIHHENQLLTKTYSFTPVEARITNGFAPVALISFCNDAIRLKNIEDKIELPEGKRYPSLPAVKIARLGVDKAYQGQDIGTSLINIVKRLFLSENRTGCRILTVDAYNDGRVTRFYEKSYFSFVTEKDLKKQTRAMFYDLKRTLDGQE